MKISMHRLESEEWQRYKYLRLESAKESPEAFTATYEELEKVMTVKEWKDWMNAYIFGAFVENELVGCMTLLRNTSERDMHATNVYGVYVQKTYRGQGIGNMLLEKIIEQANEVGIEILYLSVTVTQKPAINLYKKMGFVSYGTMPCALRVGERYLDQECMYLRLKK